MGINSDQIITISELQKFKTELIAEFKLLLKAEKGQPTKKWLKSSEVRKLLNLSPGKLQTMRKSGIIAFMRIGGAIYYDQEDINKMFDKNKVPAK